jgi:hypothetical protein
MNDSFAMTVSPHHKERDLSRVELMESQLPCASNVIRKSR